MSVSKQDTRLLSALANAPLENARTLTTTTRESVRDVMTRRFFVDRSFNIYGGVAGLYDYGPPGQAIRKNILQEWDAHFVIEDDLHEIEATQLTLEPVLRASGHVERFADLMVKDTKTGECYRLDHLIKEHIEKLRAGKVSKPDQANEYDKILAQLDGYKVEELTGILRLFNIKAPATGNDLEDPQEFNLMFSTSIGPTGLVKAFLRPETAQGIFVNFRRLLESNQSKLPFGAAQIGKAFRNEISPRSGLIRLREFTMAEIEYFVDPESKTHPKFDQIRNLQVNLYSACDQMSGDPGLSHGRKMTIGDAVGQGIISNQVLGYFIARIYMFMLRIGIDENLVRFRQHMSNEMAHYARDCWDCECYLTYGWVECVGCADRSCFDLNQHSKATNQHLTARRQLIEPKQVEVSKCIPQNAILGKTFKQESRMIADALKAADAYQVNEWKQAQLEQGFFNLRLDGSASTPPVAIEPKEIKIESNMVSFTQETKTVQAEEIVPNVIEPSFGIDRIVYAVLEHSFRKRENDEKRNYFAFPPIVAPIKCSVLALQNHADFYPIIEKISRDLKQQRVRTRLDASGESIGKRYARTDELGTAFAVTVDFDTLSEHSVTLRDRDTTEQIRVPLADITQLVRDLVFSNKAWDEAKQQYPLFTAGQQSS
ncbi:hypothetical protein GZH46_02754, partial [Fragariocoptes setiger]